MNEANLTRTTLTGVSWVYLQTIVSAVLQLVMAGVMARLVDPAAFGLIALGNLSLRFLNYFARGGIAKAIIQKPELQPDDARAGFGGSVALGLGFFGLVWLAAPLTGPLFDEPEVVPVVRWLGLSLLLSGLGATATALLQREMRFRAIALREIASYVVGYVGVGLYLAQRGAGVWALVAAMLTQVAALSLLAFVARPHDVRPAVRVEPYRRLLAFGSRVSVISFFEFLGANADTFAVGRYAGAGVLGLYNRANLLADVPTQYLGTSLSRVLFPALSSIQHDLPRLRAAYLTATRVIASVVLPAAAGMAVAAPEIILVVLGPDWRGAIPILPWLAAAAGVSMVTHFSAVVVEAQAALNAKIVVTLSKVGVLVALLVLATGRSAVWYAAALFGAGVYAQVAYVVLVRRTLRSSYRELLTCYVPPVVSAAATAAAILGIRLALIAAAVPTVLVLVSEVVTGLLSLAVLAAVGPLRPIKREVAQRLQHAGLDHDSPAPLALLARLVGVPRPVPRPTEGRATAGPEPADGVAMPNPDAHDD